MARNRSERASAGAATVGDVVAALDTLAPPALAESWDNVGLLVGDAIAQRAFDLTSSHTLYGRHNLLVNDMDEVLAEVVEILPPMKSGDESKGA